MMYSFLWLLTFIALACIALLVALVVGVFVEDKTTYWFGTVVYVLLAISGMGASAWLADWIFS